MSGSITCAALVHFRVPQRVPRRFVVDLGDQEQIEIALERGDRRDARPLDLGHQLGPDVVVMVFVFSQCVRLEPHGKGTANHGYAPLGREMGCLVRRAIKAGRWGERVHARPAFFGDFSPVSPSRNHGIGAKAVIFRTPADAAPAKCAINGRRRRRPRRSSGPRRSRSTPSPPAVFSPRQM